MNNEEFGYRKDREWADNYIPQVQSVLLKQYPPFRQGAWYEDTKQATDLVWLVNPLEGSALAVRIRRPGYGRYIHQFTIRSHRDSGAMTELAKIRQGHGDLFFYAHADWFGTTISTWMLIDLDVFRRAYDDIAGKERVKNADGTEGQAFSVFKCPKEICIASFNGWVARDWNTWPYPGPGAKPVFPGDPDATCPAGVPTLSHHGSQAR